MTQPLPVKCVCARPYTSTRESSGKARKAMWERERGRNAHSTARHLSVPVQCLRKCTLILAIKEQIVRGAMPALTAAVQWGRLQGGRRLAPPPFHPTLLQPLCIHVNAQAQKKPLTDVRGSSIPDERVTRLAPYLRGTANVLICEVSARQRVTTGTFQ